MIRNFKSVIFVLTVVTVMIAAVLCCYHKQAMHEDEFYSFYSSNRTNGFIAEGTQTRDAVMDELIVKTGKGYDFNLVKVVQTWDVHPPVYYFILHFICSLDEEKFSMWHGLIINLVSLFGCMLLMKKLGTILMPDKEILTDLVILAWGTSCATLSAAVFIRMYMLMTLCILAVTYLHVEPKHISSEEGTCRVRPWFWPVLGVITFVGFMIHYYFFIWLFFLAVAWNLKEMIETKSIRTTLYYGIMMIVTFGLCFLFYPVYPVQMFRGHRGAQATGTFFDLSNTWERLGFFGDIVNRLGFGCLLWVIIGLTLILCILCFEKHRGARPRTALWTPGENTDRMYYAAPVPREPLSDEERDRIRMNTVLLIAWAAYFLVVSKTGLILGDTSVRYQTPPLAVAFLCIFAVLDRYVSEITSFFSPDEKRNGIYEQIGMYVIIAVMIFINVTMIAKGSVQFLFPEKREHINTLSEYPDADVYYVFPEGDAWVIWTDMSELLTYDEVTYMSSAEFNPNHISELIPASDRKNAGSPIILYVDNAIEIPADSGYELIFSNRLTDTYILE